MGEDAFGGRPGLARPGHDGAVHGAGGALRAGPVGVGVRLRPVPVAYGRQLHSDLSFTKRTYVHPDPQSLKAGSDKLAELLG